ncbi:MAG TPA: class I adenylate-forming enzyme family protein, partial [Pseudolabrys sp.]|nr:class I adenylate-forming enzyme family protein [Pseudolabrys sp.]
MILGDDERGGGKQKTQGGATLDSLFRRAGVRHAQAVALADPPDRYRITDGVPRALTFADADRAISGVAAQLRGLGLPTDAMVAIHLGNTVESVIALLGVLRAGMIAIPLPLLWRKQEIVAALGQVGAKAIITTPHVGNIRTSEVAVDAAVELFTIRHVCGFGRGLPDGIVPLDGNQPASSDATNAPARSGEASAHVAVVTFETTSSGFVAVARSHRQLIAGGLAVALEAGHREDASVLTAVPLTSFAGLALALVPWLMSGGTLHLHHPFAPEAFATQRKEIDAGLVVLPGPTLPALGRLSRPSGETIAALWRNPERLTTQPAWYGPSALVDVAAFGEVGLIASRRRPGAEPDPLPHGVVGASRRAANAEPL